MMNRNSISGHSKSRNTDEPSFRACYIRVIVEEDNIYIVHRASDLRPDMIQSKRRDTRDTGKKGVA
jgi:hypothetical protein